MDPTAASEGITQQLLTQGPLGIAVVVLLWYIGQLLKERKDMMEAHKVEIAAERKLNADLQAARLEDHKTLIPLAQSLRTGVDLVVKDRQ